MNTIIDINDHRDSMIDIRQLRVSNRRLDSTLLSPAQEVVTTALAPEHTSEPIKDMVDIDRISKFLIASKRFRDNMLFIVGINFGLRASDLRMLRFSNLINENLVFKDSFPVFEKKTRNTRKRKKNRYITINDAVVEAVTLYLENTPNVSLSDYLFRSESRNSTGSTEPITIQGINLILKGIASDLGLNVKFSSHSLRKTFCYWMMVQGHNEPRRLLLLQKMLGHSSTMQTLTYIGLDADEIADAYRNLNIGYSQGRGNVINSVIFEEDAV